MPHARRRNNSGGNVGQGTAENGILKIDPETIENHDPNLTRCCVPTDCLVEQPIHLDNLANAIKVSCNNESCTQGQYMHRECFEYWEQGVLNYLRSCGRARSWSEKQRLQNLWTKKGYDLAFKACGCKCTRGHLRKDLDWIPPKNNQNREEGGNNGKKKRKKSRNNKLPTLAVSTSQHHHPNNQRSESHPIKTRARANSISSTGSSPPSSGESPASPIHMTVTKKKGKFDFFFSDSRSRHGSGGNGIFSRRLDFSSFNALPRHKINSYHIKMEDEGSHGNDDTRCFLLSSLSAHRTARISCILCYNPLIVFDKYPLIDGTFFLSPRQHSKSCIEVKQEGRTQWLNAVCMGCLEGWTRQLRCRCCRSRWDGSSLVLGTMYSYDIFAAIPCCIEKLKCNACQQLVIPPEQRLPFFSDYSHPLPCPHCRTVDFHFVKPLAIYDTAAGRAR